jgi:hypothetical protein
MTVLSFMPEMSDRNPSLNSHEDGLNGHCHREQNQPTANVTMDAQTLWRLFQTAPDDVVRAMGNVFRGLAVSFRPACFNSAEALNFPRDLRRIIG